MSGFVQIIEFTTSRLDEIQALADEMSRVRDEGTVRHMLVGADRDTGGRYLTIAQFDSYESAMENSNRPETAEFAQRFASLCDGPPHYYNLDVVQEWRQQPLVDAPHGSSISISG